MNKCADRFRRNKQGLCGFTLVEVFASAGILALVVQGAVLGYAKISQQAEWTERALAAQSLASLGAEQARAAKWDSLAWQPRTGPGMADELGLTRYMQTSVLDGPKGGQPVIVTNFVSITRISSNPPVRQIRSDCVWSFMNRGLFTNTVLRLRSPDE